MKRYTLEEREEQIKFQRAYILNMIRYCSESMSEAEVERNILIYRNLLDHIDDVFGKEDNA